MLERVYFPLRFSHRFESLMTGRTLSTNFLRWHIFELQKKDKTLFSNGSLTFPQLILTKKKTHQQSEIDAIREIANIMNKKLIDKKH